MHAVTIRRLIVFGVCALGVGSLYLVPSIARSPEQLRLSGPTDEPTTSPLGAGPNDHRESSSPTGDPESPAGGGVASDTTPPDTQPSATRSKSAGCRRSTRTRNRGAVKQRLPRTPIHPSQSPTSMRRRLLHDDSPSAGRRPATTSGVIGYRIWLNGFEVATTAETRARLRWFNDDSGQHVVQIRALDARRQPKPELADIGRDQTFGRANRDTHTATLGLADANRRTERAQLPRRPVAGVAKRDSDWSEVHSRADAPLMPTPASGPGPLVVQSDRTLLLEVDHPEANACRIAIAPFAELERAPEHIHTYRLTPLGLWNARAAGHDAEQVVDTLLTYSRYPCRTRCWST